MIVFVHNYSMNTTKLSQNVRKTTPDFRFQNHEEMSHRIYDRLLYHLENKQISFIKQNSVSGSVFHQRARSVLRQTHRLPVAVLDRLEISVKRDAENFRTRLVTRDAPASLFYELRRKGDETLIARHRIAALPNFILNALICEALAREFPRDEILSCQGFCERESCLRLDIDETYGRRGFLMPVYRNKLIAALRVFRYPKDKSPFILRTREDERTNGGLN